MASVCDGSTAAASRHPNEQSLDTRRRRIVRPRLQVQLEHSAPAFGQRIHFLWNSKRSTKSSGGWTGQFGAWNPRLQKVNTGVTVSDSMLNGWCWSLGASGADTLLSEGDVGCMGVGPTPSPLGNANETETNRARKLCHCKGWPCHESG